MLSTASSVLLWPSKWCLTRICDSFFLPLLLSGVMWMSKLTSLPALLSKNHDRPTGRPICLMACYQPCNEFTGCLLSQLYIYVRQPLWYFPKVETLDASGESLGRFCFASRATCWKHQWKTYISPPCWLIHLSISHNSLLKAMNFSPLPCDGRLTFEKYIRELSV